MTRRRKDTARAGRHKPAGAYRIIGGEWRGRRLSFPDEGGVRPTGDRVRETLFNWLQAVLPGASCLDLFAGSGALGMEALSRGAARVVFVDRDPSLIRSIENHLQSLGSVAGRCVRKEARRFLSSPASPFDIVFLDPPFGTQDWRALCDALAADGWLAPGARVYMEDSVEAGPPAVPPGWVILRSARAGNVGYHLASAPDGSDDEQASQDR